MSCTCMRAALKVMPPILLCWPPMSEVDVGGVVAEVEPSHRYPITCCCHVTDGSRGALWQNGIWHGSGYWSKDKRSNSSLWKKKGTHWHSWMLAEGSWRPTSGCEHSGTVGALMFTAGEKAQLMVVAVGKKLFCSWEFAVSYGVMCSLEVMSFLG